MTQDDLSSKSGNTEIDDLKYVSNEKNDFVDYKNAKSKSFNSNHNNTSSHSNRVPYIALFFFLSVFTLTILFILLPFYNITEISIFGIVVIPHDVYINLLNAIVTTTDITNFYNSNPLAFFGLIAIIAIIIAVIYRFISSFKEPESEFDKEQTNGAVTYFNFTKQYSRARFVFIKPTNDNNSNNYYKDFTGTVYIYSTDAKTNNGVYLVPDKRNNKNQLNNFFLEFPECFDIANLRNYMSEHSWITLATNLAMTITLTILVVGSLLNVVLNILTQAQLNPYLIFGVTSWISLSAIISISVVLVWALKEIKGTYGVFRIITVSKSPLDIDRYLVIPYYYDGISGNEINQIMTTFLTFNKTKNNLLPVVYEETAINLLEDAKEDIADKQDNIIDFNLSETHTLDHYKTEAEQLKNRIKSLEMEKDRALLLVGQLADDNTSLKKIIRARKSIDYSNIRSMNALQEQSPQPAPVQFEHVSQQSNTPAQKRGNSYVLPMIIVIILIAIGGYWASITFDPTQFLVLVVVCILFIVVIALVVGLIFLRQYLNESSAGKRINFG